MTHREMSREAGAGRATGGWFPPPEVDPEQARADYRRALTQGETVCAECACRHHPRTLRHFGGRERAYCPACDDWTSLRRGVREGGAA